MYISKILLQQLKQFLMHTNNYYNILLFLKLYINKKEYCSL